VIATELGKAGLTEEDGGQWRRIIIIEKPFGRDLASAKELNKTLHQSFSEHQIYRIDHYLGKETVQNIMAYRFGNGTVEATWNHRYIDHVQITVAESLGVEDRASYYEEAEAIRDEQLKVLKAIQPLDSEQVLINTVRGQYGEGTQEDGKELPAHG